MPTGPRLSCVLGLRIESKRFTFLQTEHLTGHLRRSILIDFHFTGHLVTQTQLYEQSSSVLRQLQRKHNVLAFVELVNVHGGLSINKQHDGSEGLTRRSVAQHLRNKAGQPWPIYGSLSQALSATVGVGTEANTPSRTVTEPTLTSRRGLMKLTCNVHNHFGSLRVIILSAGLLTRTFLLHLMLTGNGGEVIFGRTQRIVSEQMMLPGCCRRARNTRKEQMAADCRFQLERLRAGWQNQGRLTSTHEVELLLTQIKDCTILLQ